MTVRPSRRETLRLLAAAGGAGLCAPAGLGQAWANDAVRYFRIGTGATAGTYYPVGQLLANAISKPPGSRDCDRGGSCGVPGLIAVAQSTSGSVQNVQDIGSGRLDSALVQADVGYWAFHGSGVFQGKPPIPSLRLIASLYPEAIHIVVRRETGILNGAQLKNRRVAIGEEGSGTLVHARLVLEAFGLQPYDVTAVNLTPGASADALRAGAIDAFFFSGGTPSAVITALAEAVDIALVPVSGDAAALLVQKAPFLAPLRIPAQDYKNVPETATLSVVTQWLVAAAVPDELVYGIAKALWHELTAALLARGHPVGRYIKVDSALAGAALPVHAGALRYYKEIGKA